MKRTLPRLAALVPMVWLSTVAALGLGDIDVKSRLNQRLIATIPLTAVGVDDAESIRVALANASEFARAGIERSDYLSTLAFRVVTEGMPRIEVSSSQVAREPFLNFLLEVRGVDGRVLREYTILLDPPELAARQQAVAPVTARPALTPAPRPTVDQNQFYETAEEAARKPAPAPQPAPVAPVAPVPQPVVTPQAAAPVASSTVAEPEISGETYGPIRNAETLWSVATRMRPDASITMDQVLLAIYRNNPKSFDGGGINGLMRGSRLQVPSAAQMREVTAEEAKAEVAHLRGLPVASRASRPAVVAVPPAVAPAMATPIKPITAPAAKATAPAVVEPVVAAPVAAAAPAVETPAETPAAATPAEAIVAADGATPAAGVSTEAAAAAPTEPQPAATADEEIVVSGPIVPEKKSGLLEDLLLPLILGLALLGAVGYLIARLQARRKNKADTEPGPFGVRPKVTPSKIPPGGKSAVAAVAGTAAAAQRLSAKEELERLQESLDETVETSAATQQLSTQKLSPDASKTAQIPAADATQVVAAPPPAAVGGNSDLVDFDLTGQFESQTVQINLDANDPLSEADFHLAYGLYDEAALLLKQASEKEPGRTDLRVKLAETYFAAGRADEFEQTALALQPKLSNAEWQKIAIMGQQLCPDVSVFAGAAAATVAVDMAFDEPATVSTAARDAGLDFSLEDLELPSLEQGGGERLAVAQDNALEFDLSQFDTDPKPAAAAPAAATVAHDNALEFDLSQFDTNTTAAPAAAADISTALAPADTQLIDLDQFDIGDDIQADSTTISGDEAGTKLDLARAYVDMGDNEMARSLLGEVLLQGNDGQKQDAQALIARLV